MVSEYLLGRMTWAPDELMKRHPPQLASLHKQTVFDLCRGRSLGVPVEVSRWRAMPLPDRIGDGADLTIREDVFGYEAAEAGAAEWYLNFADAHLFVAYGTPLFAQDEMQVAEHPVLASVREALVALADPALAPLTREIGGATPVLVRNAERRCAIATDPDAAAGRPQGLYGNRFAAASLDAVRRATRALSPPTHSNILAVVAPSGGRGAYTAQQISGIATTVFTGFAAARAEGGGEVRTIVHTGHWGCGAYGGNRVLMAALQVLAARMAGIDRLVFHTADSAGSAPVGEATALLEELVPAPGAITTAEALAGLARPGFVWGVSDGN
jgi:hypothetical protein